MITHNILTLWIYSVSYKSIFENIMYFFLYLHKLHKIYHNILIYTYICIGGDMYKIIRINMNKNKRWTFRSYYLKYNCNHFIHLNYLHYTSYIK